MKGPRKWDEVLVMIAGENIPLKRELKYLGIWLGGGGGSGRPTYSCHIRKVVEEAEKRVTALSRILPNVGGPSFAKRRALKGVFDSTILYGASVWKEAVRTTAYTALLTKAQRRLLIRMARAYRTTSNAALQVVTGTPPMDLLVLERAAITETDEQGPPPHRRVKAECRAVTIRRWKARWEEETSQGRRTREVIHDLEEWVKCPHRTCTYGLTQFLTGHGSFGSYLSKIGKYETSACAYCEEDDTPDHTILQCDRWADRRRADGEVLAEVRNGKDLVQKMLLSKKLWQAATKMIEDIITSKEQEERTRQARERAA